MFKNEYGVFKKGIMLDIPVVIPISDKDDFLETISKEEWLNHAKDEGCCYPQVAKIGVEVKEIDKGRALAFIYKYFENV